MRLAVVMLLVIVMLSGCGTADDTPTGGDSSDSGAAATVVADQATLPGPERERPGHVGVATTSDQRDAQWARFRLTDSPPSVDSADRVLLFIGFGESGSCPYIFDGLEIDDQTLRVRNAQDQQGCTDDFHPRTVVLRIEREALPEGFITVHMPNAARDAVIALPESAEPPPATRYAASTASTNVNLALEPDSVPGGDDVTVQIANTTEHERVRSAPWVRIDRWTGHHFEAVGEIDPGDDFVKARPGETAELMSVSTADPVFAAGPGWFRVTAPSLNFMSGEHGRISEAHHKLQVGSSAASAPESTAPESGSESTDEDPEPASDAEEGGPNEPGKDPAVVSLMDDYGISRSQAISQMEAQVGAGRAERELPARLAAVFAGRAIHHDQGGLIVVTMTDRGLADAMREHFASHGVTNLEIQIVPNANTGPSER